MKNIDYRKIRHSKGDDIADGPVDLHWQIVSHDMSSVLKVSGGTCQSVDGGTALFGTDRDDIRF